MQRVVGVLLAQRCELRCQELQCSAATCHHSSGGRALFVRRPSASVGLSSDFHPTFVRLSSDFRPSDLHPISVRRPLDLHPTSIRLSSDVRRTCIRLLSHFRPTSIRHSSDFHPIVVLCLAPCRHASYALWSYVLRYAVLRPWCPTS